MKCGTSKLGLLLVFLLLSLGLISQGCSDDITDTEYPVPVTIKLGFNMDGNLKSGPAATYRLRVSAAEMDTVRVNMESNENGVEATIIVFSGRDRYFLVEALDSNGRVLYRGESLLDLGNTSSQVHLTIDGYPVAPMVFINPHLIRQASGSDFILSIRINDLPGLTGLGIGLSLPGEPMPDKASQAVVIDTLVIDPHQTSLGSVLSYNQENPTTVYLELVNGNSPLVDENGDAGLVTVYLHTTDIWSVDPIELETNLWIEYFSGVETSTEDVHVDQTRISLYRDHFPELFLGGPFDDSGIALSSQGLNVSILAATTTDSLDQGTQQLFLASLGDGPQPLWTRTLDWPMGLWTTGFSANPLGEYFVTAGNSFFEGKVLGFDVAGNLLWEENLADYGQGTPYSVAALPSGGCVVAGAWANDGLHAYLALFDGQGHQHTYQPTNFSSDQVFRSVVSLDDSTFVAAGIDQDYGASSWAILTKIRLEENLSAQWSRSYSGEPGRSFNDVLVLHDGGFLAVGATDRPDGWQSDVFVVRTDSEGELIWTRSFGSASASETGTSVCADPSGGYVIAGHIRLPDENRDVFVLKLDDSGNLIWQNTLGGPESDTALDILATGGGFLVTGNSTLGPHGQRDILLLRLNSYGEK